MSPSFAVKIVVSVMHCYARHALIAVPAGAQGGAVPPGLQETPPTLEQQLNAQQHKADGLLDPVVCYPMPTSSQLAPPGKSSSR